MAAAQSLLADTCEEHQIDVAMELSKKAMDVNGDLAA